MRWYDEYYPVGEARVWVMSSKAEPFNRCAQCTLGCTKICLGYTTKKEFTKVHHKLVTLNR